VMQTCFFPTENVISLLPRILLWQPDAE